MENWHSFWSRPYHTDNEVIENATFSLYANDQDVPPIFPDWRHICFGAVTTDLQTNILQTTHRQDYPYTTFTASETRSLSGAALTTTINTYGATNLGGTRNQVFRTQSQVISNDLDGTPLPTATST
jgi:hypothetical protein